jgi:hypothetical protein
VSSISHVFVSGVQIRTIGHTCEGDCICTRDEDGDLEIDDECPATGHSGIVTRVQFSDDGLQVISGSSDGTVLVSPIVRARSHDELRGHCWCAHAARSSQQVRFWDVASGQQVRQVLGDEFALVEGDAAQHQAGRHILTARGNMLLIYDGGAEEEAASAVACFRAPEGIETVHCYGGSICVGCGGGAVCILQAPFLAA